MTRQKFVGMLFKVLKSYVTTVLKTIFFFYIFYTMNLHFMIIRNIHINLKLLLIFHNNNYNNNNNNNIKGITENVTSYISI